MGHTCGMPIEVQGRIKPRFKGRHDLRARDMRFSLTYSEDKGWDEPDSPFLRVLRGEIAEAEEGESLQVFNMAVPSEPALFDPTVDSDNQLQVMSTLVALAPTVTTKFKWSATQPIGEPTWDDQWTPEQYRNLRF